MITGPPRVRQDRQRHGRIERLASRNVTAVTIKAQRAKVARCKADHLIQVTDLQGIIHGKPAR